MKIKFNFKILLLILIFSLNIFLRFYELETKSPFGWDQVISAWEAKNIIVDQRFPILGYQAKLNSGLYIGPFYYYLIVPFYFFTRLDPIASGIFAGFTSIFIFWALFYVIKNIFSTGAALIALFINSVSIFSIIFERTQWNVNFIPIISLLVFYSLYKVLTGDVKYLILLSISLGFFFHVHLTVIFFPFIMLLTLPLIPRTKRTLKYLLISLPLFLVWLVPIWFSLFQGDKFGLGPIQYGSVYFLGFHLRRVLQLTGDAFIQFEPYLIFNAIKSFKFILIPLFIFIYLYRNLSKEKIILCYLVLLWFLIPWAVMSTYGGELSDYYFSANRFVALAIISFTISKLFSVHFLGLKIALIILMIYYGIFNFNKFMLFKSGDNLQDEREKILRAISKGEKIEFKEGVPGPYLFYIYTDGKIKK